MIFEKPMLFITKHTAGASSDTGTSRYPRIWRDRTFFFNVIIGRTPRSTPIAFWRSIGTMKALIRITTSGLVLIGIGLLGVLVINFTLATRILDEGGIILVVGWTIAHSIIFVYGLRFALRRYRAFLKNHDWQVCMQCGYILEHLSSNQKCPECGEAYDSETIRKYWQAWINLNMASKK